MNKSLQKVIDTIQAHMAEGQLFWHKPFITAYQANAKSKAEYRGINALVTALVAYKRGYASPYWATFKQIKDMGGTLKDAKGAGIPIIFYKDLSSDDEDDKKRCVMRHSFVFNLDLVEGIEIKIDNPEALEPIQEDLQASELIRQYLKRECILTRHGNPAYVPSTDSVRMLPIEQFCSSEEYYSAYFHELAHSTGHDSRLARFAAEQTKLESKEDYSKEELVAEISAAMLCHLVGVDSQTSIKNSAAYIQGWSQFIKDNAQAFVSAVNQAYKAKDFILGRNQEG